MENIEPTGIPQNEEHLEALEATISKLEETLKQKENIINRHEKIFEELEELKLIIEGLYQKVESLIEKSKRIDINQPQTEEGWADWISRTERVFDLYSRIAYLEQEYEGLATKADVIQKEFENLD